MNKTTVFVSAIENCVFVNGTPQTKTCNSTRDQIGHQLVLGCKWYFTRVMIITTDSRSSFLVMITRHCCSWFASSQAPHTNLILHIDDCIPYMHAME